MSRTAPRPLSEPLRALTAMLSPATTLARVQEIWGPATGAAIAASARPTGEREGVLTVSCEAAVWAQELELIAPERRVQPGDQLGGEDIRELRCRTG